MTGKTLTSAWGRQSPEDVGFWSYPAPPVRTVKRGLAIEVKTYSLFQGRAIRLREKGACAFYLALCIYLHKLAKSWGMATIRYKMGHLVFWAVRPPPIVDEPRSY
jgi:hypothetical protein